MQVGRLSFKCGCGAWRWCDRAEALGEHSCKECGTPFSGATVEFYPWTVGKGDRERGREREREPRHQLSGRSGRMEEAKGQGRRGPKGGNAKGSGAGAGHGGKGGSGAPPGGGPKAPGRQPNHLQQGYGGKGGGAEAPVARDNITYSKAKTDPLCRAQYMLETAKDLFGENSREAEDAQKAFQAAKQEADNRKTPAQKAMGLRSHRTTYIEAVASGVQRFQTLQEQQQEITEELERIDLDNKQNLERIQELDAKTAALEAEGGLKAPIATGGQFSMAPEDLLQRSLQATVKQAQAAIQASGALDAPDRLREYEIALGVLQGKAMSLMRDDVSDMSDVASDTEDKNEPPRAKTPRRDEPNTDSYDAAMQPREEAEEEQDDELAWTKVLGPQARRAQREQKLAARTIQDIAKRLQMQSSTGQAKGKSKGSGKSKGPGKGPLAVFAQSPTEASNPPDAPTRTRPSRWDEGAPPLLPGTRFPPAGGLQSSATPSPTEGAATSATPAEGQAQAPAATRVPTVQLSDGEWKEVQQNHGGGWPPCLVRTLQSQRSLVVHPLTFQTHPQLPTRSRRPTARHGPWRS